MMLPSLVLHPMGLSKTLFDTCSWYIDEIEVLDADFDIQKQSACGMTRTTTRIAPSTAATLLEMPTLRTTELVSFTSFDLTRLY